MDIFKFGEILEQMGSGDITTCSCHKKKKKKNKLLKPIKWSSENMSEGCACNKKKKKKIKPVKYIIEKCSSCGGLKKKKINPKNIKTFSNIKEMIL